MTAVPAMVEAVGVGRRFRSGSGAQVRALEGVSVAVPRGAFLAVTGPSGCGKSTLLALLGALDRPSEGRVVFDGVDLGDASEAALARVRRRIGLVFQHSPMLRRMPVWENVACPLVPLGESAVGRRSRAEALLARVGLSGRASSLPEELSAGEAQRVGVARALVADADLVLADEPTSNLDRASADAVAALLLEVHASGRTVIVATHDPALLARATSRCDLDAGRVVAR